MDKYNSMQKLETETAENEDWEIVTENRNSEVTVLAIHGGGIEPGTTELANVIANEGHFNYFAFNGIRKKGNNELHVTSIKYDNEIAMNLVNESYRAITVHGCQGDEAVVYVGGKDNELKSEISKQLNKIEINVQDAPSNMAGAQDNNIVNCTINGAGVQLELTSKLRQSLFKNERYNRKSRLDSSNWDETMYEFGKAINNAINNI